MLGTVGSQALLTRIIKWCFASAVIATAVLGQVAAAHARTVESVTVTPELQITATPSAPAAAPGATVPININIANAGATVGVSGELGYLGALFTNSVVKSWWAVLEYQPAGGSWTPLAGVERTATGYVPQTRAPLATGLSATTTPVARFGVTYPTASDTIIGTQVAGFNFAQWRTSFSTTATSTEIMRLLSSAQTSQIRLRTRIEAQQTGLFSTRWIGTQTRTATFTQLLRSQSASAADISATLASEAGSQSFSQANTPVLANLAPGQSAAISAPIQLPAVSGKGASESDGQYLSRLRALAARSIAASVSTDFTARGAASAYWWWLGESDPGFEVGADRRVSAQGATADAAVSLPIMEIAKNGPPSIDPGQTATYDIAVSNTGDAAGEATVSDEVDGMQSAAVAGFGAIEAGMSRTGSHAVAVPVNLTGAQLHDRASVTWSDASGNQYGPLSADVTSAVNVDVTPPDAPTIVAFPPALTASQTANFEFHGEPAGAFKCSLDAAPETDCVSPLTLVDLGDGWHGFAVWQVDDAGNVGSASSIAWQVDTRGPQSPQVSGVPADPTRSTSARIEFAGEPGGRFECRTGTDPWQTCVSPIAYSDLADGRHDLDVRQVDDAGNPGEPAHAQWTVDTVGPAAPELNSTPRSFSKETSAGFGFAGEPGGAYSCSLDNDAYSACANPMSYDDLTPNAHEFAVFQTDDAGNPGEVARFNWTIDATAPTAPQINAAPPSTSASDSATFEFTGEQGATFECSTDGAEFAACESPVTIASLDDGAHTFSVRQIDHAGNVGSTAAYSWTTHSSSGSGMPNAPAIAPTGVTPFVQQVSFLFSGPDAIQQGVAPETIVDRRVSVVRGKVFTKGNTPMGGVHVSVVGHPEFGQTLSRENGEVFMAVNGGGNLTLRFEMDGYPSVDRSVQTPWQDYVFFNDVVMTELDPNVSSIDLNEPLPTMQVAEGSTKTDADGSRRASVLFPPGTQAQLRFPDGSTLPQSHLGVRITEFTVGENGPDAMPAALPPTTAYTFAAEFSADEAISAGASGVEFSQPVWVILDNFLRIPSGTVIPHGSYDRGIAGWRSEADGKVRRVLDVVDGEAILDDGTGNPLPPPAPSQAGADSWSEMMRYVANRFSTGDTFWMVPMNHFSWADFNFPWEGPEDVKTTPKQAGQSKPVSKPCHDKGSIIECENQALGERIAIPGTGLTLNYRSDRAPGRTTSSSFDVRLMDGVPPASLQKTELTVDIAGARHEMEFVPTETSYRFNWDGLDWAGRPMTGTQTAHVRLTHVYPAVYRPGATTATSAWAKIPSGSASLDARRDGVVFQVSSVFDVLLAPPIDASWMMKDESVAGWEISSHHRYDPQSQATIRGDGTRQHPDTMDQTLRHFAGDAGYDGDDGGGENNATSSLDHGMPPRLAVVGASSIAAGLFNSVPLAAVGSPDIGDPFGIGDGGSAQQAIMSPEAMTVGDDGSVYFANENPYLIRRIDPDGIVTTIAGTGDRGDSGDGGPAMAAQVGSIAAMTIGHSGELYFIQDDKVRRIDATGVISTFAGGADASGPLGDDGPATDAKLNKPHGLAIGLDGSLYVADYGNGRVRHVDLSGVITTIAAPIFPNSDGVALLPTSLVVAPTDGAIYVGTQDFVMRVDPVTNAVSVRDDLNPRLVHHRLVAGLAVTTDDRLYVLADGETFVSRPDTGLHPLVDQTMRDPQRFDDCARGDAKSIAGAPNGDLYSVCGYEIWHYGATFTDHLSTGVTIPDESGNALQVFDAFGRHVETRDGLTNANLMSFGYDANNQLTSLTDADGNATTIERNAEGDPTAIVAPFGQRTELSVGADHLLSSVAAPAGETFSMTYDPTGLLKTFTKPNGATSHITYDARGRLIKDEDALGGFKSLDIDGNGDDFTVSVSDARGATRTHRVRREEDGSQERTVTRPSGSQTTSISRTDGSTSRTLADGTQINSTSVADQRFGAGVRVPENETLTTPGGLTRNVQHKLDFNLAQWWDPSSWRQATETTTTNGKTATSRFDHSTLTLTSQSPNGRQKSEQFDSVMRPLRLTVPGLYDTSIQYDQHGRATSISQGDRTASAAYDDSGNLAQSTDSLGRVTTYEYDADGRVVASNLPGGRRIEYQYDADGNVTSVTPPSRPVHEFDFNAMDAMTAASSPEESTSPRTTTYEYDTPDHKLSKITRPSGAEVDFGFDSAGRLTGVTAGDGTSELSYHPTSGKLATLSSPDNENLAFSFDGPLATGQTLTGEVAGSSTITYNDDLQPTSATVADSTVTFAHDDDGLLTSAGDLSLASDPQNGLLTGVTLADTSTQITRDGFGAPSALTTTTAGSGLYTAAFTRDAAGRITTKQETRPSGITTYAYNYDPSGHLENVHKDGLPYASYLYDQNGNRTSQTIAGTTTYATFDTRDRMKTQGDLDLTYNDNGELTQKRDRTTGDTLSLSYSTLGDLTSATTADGRQINYLLDGAGRRVGKKVDGALTEGLLYAPGASGPAAELDGENNLAARFIYATNANVPDYMVKDGTTYRVITDQLGSVVMVVNASTGAIAQELTYGPFGEVLTDSNPGFQPFGFAGGVYDTDTGLVHFGAREYDAELGRWTASDPIGFGGGDSNLYGYVLGDPVNFVDPSGNYVEGQPQHWAEPIKDEPSHPLTTGICDGVGVHFVYGATEEWCYVHTPNGDAEIRNDGHGWGVGAGLTGGPLFSNARCPADLSGEFVHVGGGAGTGIAGSGGYSEGIAQDGKLIWVAQGGVGVGAGVGSTNRINTTILIGDKSPCGCDEDL